MDGAHGCGESEGIGLGSDLGDDFVWTKVLLRELLGWTSDSEVLGLDIDAISDVQLRRRCTTLIGRSLVSELCFTDILLEMLVEFFEVDREFMSASGGERVFGVNGDVGMVALVGEEWRDTRSIAWGGVVGKLRERQEFGPVVLLVVAVDSEILLKSLVWLVRSVCPSASGWYPEVKCKFMLRALPRARKNRETNSEPRSEVTCDGVPCLEKTWRMKSLANSGESMVSWVGMKILCLLRRSTTTRMAVNPSDLGSCSMKSMEMESQGRSGIGSCCTVP